MSDDNRNNSPDTKPTNIRGLDTRGPYWAAGSIIAIAWLLYLLKVLFDVDLIALLHPERSPLRYKHDDLDFGMLYLIMAIVATVAGLMWASVKSRKMRELSSKGMRTQGTLVSKSILRRHGRVPATIVYTVDGAEYTIKKDVDDSSHEVGDTLQILYDPANPKRCEVIW